MNKGTKEFKCDECGNRFNAMDIEWMGTTLSTPMPCPNCKSRHTYPYRMGLGSLEKSNYRKIWNEIDSEKENR